MKKFLISVKTIDWMDGISKWEVLPKSAFTKHYLDKLYRFDSPESIKLAKEAGLKTKFSTIGSKLEVCCFQLKSLPWGDVIMYIKHENDEEWENARGNPFPLSGSGKTMARQV